MIFKKDEEKMKMRSKLDETDAFWDIDEITPMKRAGKTPFAKASVFDGTDSVILTEVNLTENKPIENKTEKLYNNTDESDILYEYVSKNNAISNVKIGSWNMKYTFYERFRLDARKYYDKTAEKCPEVKYFSYMPGFLQMSSKQREWYFYWRSCVRNGQYIPTDSSYILLYIYEIINLPDMIDAKKGLGVLCDIWENYRESYTKLDKYMSEWVCDYCLVYGLPVPFDRIKGFIDSVMTNASLKQFYIECVEDSLFASLLMERYSSYRWRSSKYVTEENRGLFEEHIKKGFCYAVDSLAASDGRFDKKGGRLVKRAAVRDSFVGAQCACSIKKKMQVEYYDVENSRDIGFIVTDMVKYCENRVRAYLGIRARLAVKELTEYQKKAIDEYFDAHLPVKTQKKDTDRETVGYEYKTEPQKPFTVSYEAARKIENDSWSITDRLTEDIEIEEETAVIEEIGNAEPSVVSETLDVAKQALLCIARGDGKGFGSLAEECYMMPETLAECVNELCYEIVGDIGIEETADGYRVISDYEREILKWLKL